MGQATPRSPRYPARPARQSFQPRPHVILSSMLMSRTSWWRVLAPVAVGGAFLVLTALERRRPLRRVREAKWRHVSRNIVFAGAAAATVNLLERPVVEPLANVVERRRCGLLYLCRLPRPLHIVLAIVLLDYTLYVWHVLTHRVSWLWRFHLVHHVDRDLDASTALRFHAGELALSIPWRALQIAAIGVPLDALLLWQNMLLLSILFHHSNVELPVDVERLVAHLVVTPRLHGIHHSIVPAETNSNWSSGLTLWDYLHGTLRLDVPQQAITIGVPAYPAPEDVTLANSFALPFGAQRPWQVFPDDLSNH
ncbi:MAG: fatty acid hydroxylase [Acidobacteria bacterium]|nr:MAG: fatty acid hydroxylase [Acidobacteriota bacterium]